MTIHSKNFDIPTVNVLRMNLSQENEESKNEVLKQDSINKQEFVIKDKATDFIINIE